MLNERGAYMTRRLETGQVIDLFPLTFGRMRLTLSQSLEDEIYGVAY